MSQFESGQNPASVATRWQKGQSGNPGGLTADDKRHIAEVRQLALEYSKPALMKLVELLGAENQHVQLAAANSILDRGLGKPVQALVGDENSAPLQLAGIIRLTKPEAAPAANEPVA